MNISDYTLFELPSKVFIALVKEYTRLGVVKISTFSYNKGCYCLSAIPCSPLNMIFTRSYSESYVNKVKDYFRKCLDSNIIIVNS